MSIPAMVAPLGCRRAEQAARQSRKDSAMKIAMIIHEDTADLSRRDDPAQAQAYWGAWMAYVQAINAAGIVTGGAGLELPARATTLRLRQGERLVQDGPYADTKEQLGGFFLLEVPDLTTALEWAARCPAAATGTIELRPCLAGPMA
jgi:hypothetical protein